jgi:hypothetical protein
MIEIYDALCLKEPWLELILLAADGVTINIKTLETRTKCLRKTAGELVLVSSKGYDEEAWVHPWCGGRLDAAAKKRALDGLGKLRGIAMVGGFRVGVPGVDDQAASIQIRQPDGELRFVAEVSNVRRLVEVPTVRVRPKDGAGNEVVVPGGGQGIFRVPANIVQIVRRAV